MSTIEDGGRLQEPSDDAEFKYKVESHYVAMPVSGAQFRIKWLDSAEYKQFKRIAYVLVPLLILSIVAFVYVTYLNLTGTIAGPYSMLMTMTPVAIVPTTSLVGIQLAYQLKRRVFRDRFLIEQASELASEEKEVADKSTDGQLDLPSLWTATQTRIGYYHNIATTQAEQSFRVGTWAAVAGFVAVVVLGIVAAFAPNGTAAIAASVVGVAGAAMSAYIGATFMKTQAQASNQLSKFFLQPVEFSRLLGAERLLQTLPPDQRSEVVSTMVKGMMIASNNDEAEKKEPTS